MNLLICLLCGAIVCGVVAACKWVQSNKQVGVPNRVVLIIFIIVLGLIAIGGLASLITTQKNEPVTTQKVSGELWKTKSTGIVHNPSCRYYMKADGDFVDADYQGKNCKICGGNGQ